MGLLQQFHLILKYKKGGTNNLVEMLSRPHMPKIMAFGTFMHMEPFTHDAYKFKHTKYDNFKKE